MMRLETLRRRLADDSGISLPEVMIGAMVSTATLAAIVGLIIGLSSVTISSLARSQAVVEQQTTEMQFRQDMASSVALAATDDKGFTAVDAAGCVTSTWSIDTAGRIRVAKSGALLSSGTCDSGYAAEFDTMANAGADAQFVYNNAAGRSLTITDGAFTASDEPRPEGATEAHWDSIEPRLITLTGITGDGSRHARPFAFTTDLPGGGVWTGDTTSTETP
tara:strand:- start:12091 stop:12750 length:660 start_codon:yes stop_codon:yes gene_type:complete